MANKMELRRINRNLIYRCIYEHDEISRQDVAALTDLSIPTVIQNLSDLEEKGLIRTDGVFESTGGRRAKVIKCAYDAAYSVGIDITVNHLTIVVIDLKGDILWGGAREKFPYSDTDEYYDAVCAKLDAILDEGGVDRGRIIGVGISLPSIIDSNNRRVTYGKILGEPADIRDRFAARLPFKVNIFNDANSAGYAETWSNKSDGMRFYLMLSNSVGGATINGSELYRGDNCRASEIGHIKLIPGGAPCYCGQKGCVNAYLSSRILSEEYDGRLENFFELLEAGDEHCRALFDTYLDYLSITVVNLRMLYDCEIILGGYVGAFMDKYMDELGKRLTADDPYNSDFNYVLPCHYKKEASAVGAALPYAAEFMDNI